jgi:hypothetical protein
MNTLHQKSVMHNSADVQDTPYIIQLKNEIKRLKADAMDCEDCRHNTGIKVGWVCIIKKWICNDQYTRNSRVRKFCCNFKPIEKYKKDHFEDLK